MITATVIGQYFLSKNPELTDIQIQKLVYYTYVWYMVLHEGKKIFEEKPEAWIHGPVFRSLFNSMKDYDKFSKLEQITEVGEANASFFDKIYNVYGKYSGNELERMIHSELPWIKVNANDLVQVSITDKDIMKCYGNA